MLRPQTRCSPALAQPNIRQCALTSASVAIRSRNLAGLWSFRQSRGVQSKPFYVTTPIFYVNANPHVGHLYTMLITDVVKRYKIFTGQQAVLLTGTDEHGLKIQNAARQASVEPQEFCDQVSDVFRELPVKANISNDIFMRTSSPAHKAAVTHFWRVLREKGLLYQDSHEGWYSTSDETFYPASAIYQEGDKHYSTETGTLVQWTREQNYHFRLSAFKDRLLDFYRENPDFITPQAQYREVVASVEAGLADLSVSRPVQRLSWGVRVPDDDSQTIYVWLDALVNYITAAGYPKTSRLWPADLHVIGKDIVRFHCIYWPAFLMAAGLELPKKIVTHAHWTMGDYKMSKSRGNVANPWTAIDRFGLDTVRYYLMRDGRLEDDTNYSNEKLIQRNNHELVNGLGNLVARATSATFDTDAIMANRPSHEKFGSSAKDLLDECHFLVERYHVHMNAVVIHLAVSAIVSLVNHANAFFQKGEPWSKTCTAEHRAEVIYACLETARIAALLLQPIIPDSASRSLDRLGVHPSRRSSAFARFGEDDSYRPFVLQKGTVLFKAIKDEPRQDPRLLSSIPRLEVSSNNVR